MDSGSTTSTPTLPPAHASTERPSSGDTDTIAEKQQRKRVNGWWWWEILGAALSCVAMVLLLVLLIKSDGLSLESWTLPIRPNSLISVFTTVAKTAMMVPVASCLSQLKWRHFTHNGDKMSALQVFDDASRGPWGSAMLLFNLRRRAVLAWALAVVTMAGLAVGPSAQQILDFPTRVSPLNNVTAIIGQANNYVSRGNLEGDRTNSLIPNPDLLKLQAAILNGASGQVFQPTLDCPSPATSCEWPKITTLGICSRFQNVTDTVTRNCTGKINVMMNCTYEFPNRFVSDDELIEMSYNDQRVSTAPRSDLFRSGAHQEFDDFIGEHLSFQAVKVVGHTTSGDGGHPPATEVYQARLYWCERTFENVTASPRGLDRNPGTSEPLTWKDHFEVPSGGEDRDDGDMKTDYRYSTYMANSTGREYNITPYSSLALVVYLSKFLSRHVFDHTLEQAEDLDEMLNIGTFLYTSDLRNITENVATTLTNQIRSNSSGDNSEAFTVEGEAFISEVYIKVRWGWLILPMIESALALALLIVVIVATRSQPVLKESVMPYIIYGREAEVTDALQSADPVTGEEMSKAAEKVSVRLVKMDGASRGFVVEERL
ncbi:hypothetical protein ACJ41O_009317 [Fusarium nematophilum]